MYYICDHHLMILFSNAYFFLQMPYPCLDCIVILFILHVYCLQLCTPDVKAVVNIKFSVSDVKSNYKVTLRPFLFDFVMALMFIVKLDHIVMLAVFSTVWCLLLILCLVKLLPDSGCYPFTKMEGIPNSHISWTGEVNSLNWCWFGCLLGL